MSLCLILGLFACKETVEISTDQTVEKQELVYQQGVDQPFSGVVYTNYDSNPDNVQRQYQDTYEDGKLHGLTTQWYKNGQKYKEGSYKHGDADGIWTWWFRDGKMKQKVSYSKGVVEGDYEIYFDNGNLWARILYKNGKAWESLEHYYRNGVPVDQNTLKDGKGKLHNYDPYGVLITIETYEKGSVIQTIENTQR